MSEREWRFYLNDMLRFADKVCTYSAGVDRDTFEGDELRYDAILRNLELIGRPRPMCRPACASSMQLFPGVRSLLPETA
jgi:uncharacterized protein with HEPN domain